MTVHSQAARKAAKQVAKLLALAADQKGTPEGAAAAAAARAVMERHALSEGDVADAGDPMAVLRLKIWRHQWAQDILHACAVYAGGRALFLLAEGVGVVFGRTSAVQVIGYLAEYLIAEIKRRWSTHAAGQRDTLGPLWDRGYATRQRARFCNGAAAALCVRLRDMLDAEKRGGVRESTPAAAAEALPAADGTALVLSTRAARIEEADAWAREQTGGAEVKTRKDHGRSASIAGIQAGRDIQINKGLQGEPS